MDVRFVEPKFGGMSKTTLYDLNGLSKRYLGKVSTDGLELKQATGWAAP